MQVGVILASVAIYALAIYLWWRERSPNYFVALLGGHLAVLLSPFWQALSHLNPFFYIIDGFRHGFFGVSDTSPWTSLAVVCASLALMCALCLHLLRIGYKIRH